MVDYDVMIAGAGTGGATTAYALAKRGHSVLLIDRKEHDNIGNKTCGDALGSHHIRELRELVGIPELPKGIVEYEVNGIDLIAPDRDHRLRMEGPTTTGMSFNRLKMGQWFVSLAEQAGSEVMASTRVKKLLFENGKVSGLRIAKEGEADKDLTSRIVVDATGATGMLRMQMPKSSPIEKQISNEDRMVAWRDIYETPDFDFETPDILEIFWNQDETLGGYTWVFPQGKNRVNVGNGVMTIDGHRNPKDIQYDFVKKTWIDTWGDIKVLDSSGGVAPIRRPIDTMVDDNFMLVGDAACQVNPIHGGGIGSSMLGGAHAGITASEALERNDTSIESLWQYNPRYHKSYGSKQAALDIFRWFLLNITNDDIDFAFKKQIIKASDLLDTSMTGEVRFGAGEKFKRLIAGFGKIPLLLRVSKVANLMNDIRVLYAQYPESPKGLASWVSRLKPLYEAAKVI
ncbi:MAG: NAD(P)/FAD-dependent oxidoreductase [Candidatus Thorarchaeota archaeon]|nr:NAD(P)/FAD-dependent oxidoreductase [Candidatus Thorarchaeota archaeon]